VERRDFLKMISCAGLACILPQCGSRPLRTGDMAPELTVIDLAGKRVVLPGELKGKVVLLHFWASWCGSCKDEMRDLQSIYAQYGSQGVVPCSVSIGDSINAAEAYLKDVQVSYPVFIDEDAMAKKIYNISGVPTTYLLSRDGIVKFMILGLYGRNVKEGMLKTLL
jgi:cytochrome c biogenesis protein CcmG, thiol:disulfide interchange protein DsbE